MAEPVVRIGAVSTEDVEMEGNNEIDEALETLEGAEAANDEEELTMENELVKPTYLEQAPHCLYF